MIEHLKNSLDLFKEKKPLVLCLTNYVTMDFLANSLLALGAAPLMSESIEELEELVHLSDAVYINIGTLNQNFVIRAAFAAQIANSLDKPIVLDPVGAGASQLRTNSALQLLTHAHIIRGNASEIRALAGTKGPSKGVESTFKVEQATDEAHHLAQNLDKTIIISGPQDFITNGAKTQTLPFGSSMMSLITGMGCTLTAVISAFAALNSNYFQASVYATAYFGLCGQQASQQAKAPGIFRQHFINNLFHPDWDYFLKTWNNAHQTTSIGH